MIKYGIVPTSEIDNDLYWNCRNLLNYKEEIDELDCYNATTIQILKEDVQATFIEEIELQSCANGESGYFNVYKFEDLDGVDLFVSLPNYFKI